MSKACSNCNAENVDEAKFCRNCGKQELIKKEINFKDDNSLSYALSLEEFKNGLLELIYWEIDTEKEHKNIWDSALVQNNHDKNIAEDVYAEERLRYFLSVPELEEEILKGQKGIDERLLKKQELLKETKLFTLLNENGLKIFERPNDNQVYAFFLNKCNDFKALIGYENFQWAIKALVDNDGKPLDLHVLDRPKKLTSLEVFLLEKNMIVKKKISELKYIVGYQNSPQEERIEWFNYGWKII